MNGMRPGAIAVLAGGVALLISSFLDWRGPFSIWESTIFGLTGFFVFVIAAAAIAVAAIRAFAPQVKLPEQLLGMTLNQLLVGLGAAVTILAFSTLFADQGAKIGTILGLLAGGAITAGAYMENQAGDRSSGLL